MIMRTNRKHLDVIVVEENSLVHTTERDGQNFRQEDVMNVNNIFDNQINKEI